MSGARKFSLFSSASGFLAFRDETAGANRLVIDPLGNVGVGTASPLTRLDLGGHSTNNSAFKSGTFELQSYSVNNAWFGDNVYHNGADFVRRSAGFADWIYFNGGDIEFRVGGTAAAGSVISSFAPLVMKNSGKVGINAAAPAARLAVSGAPGETVFRADGIAARALVDYDGSGVCYFDGAEFDFRSFAGVGGVILDTTNKRLGVGVQPTEAVHVVGRVMATGNGYTNNPAGVTIGQYQAGISYIQASAGADLAIWNGLTVTNATFKYAGGVRFNTYGAGTLSTDASGNITASSDEALKDEIEPFARGLGEILQINPISFRWTAASGLDRMNRYHGFSAQDVEAAIPEAVGVGADGFLTLQDRPLVAALVNAVKALAEQNAALLARVEALEQGA